MLGSTQTFSSPILSLWPIGRAFWICCVTRMRNWSFRAEVGTFVDHDHPTVTTQVLDPRSALVIRDSGIGLHRGRIIFCVSDGQTQRRQRSGLTPGSSAATPVCSMTVPRAPRHRRPLKLSGTSGGSGSRVATMVSLTTAKIASDVQPAAALRYASRKPANTLYPKLFSLGIDQHCPANQHS